MTHLHFHWVLLVKQLQIKTHKMSVLLPTVGQGCKANGKRGGYREDEKHIENSRPDTDCVKMVMYL